MFRIGILTVSDKGSTGERPDESGNTIRAIVDTIGGEVVYYGIVPDEAEEISRKLVEWASDERIDLILTTGGTGLGPRDVTPEATSAVLDRSAPGFSEVMRAESMKKTPHGMLSRGVSGIIKRTLVINLPGSPKAVRECLEAILPALPHAIETVRGQAFECASDDDLSSDIPDQ